MNLQRWLRGGLLALVVAVLGSVAWTLRRPAASPRPEPAPAVAVPSPGPSAAQATRMGDLVYRSVKGGRESFSLRARSMSGREQEQLKLESVDAEFGYVADGQPGRGRIVSDECLYYPARQEAHFQGRVRLRTEDGLELLGDELVYDGEAGGARSTKPVSFRRQRLSGSANGMEYVAETGRLQLDGDVVVRVADQGAGETVIRSAQARFERSGGEALFQERVELTRGGDRLTAARLTLQGTMDELDRIRAAGDVVVRSTSDAIPGTAHGPARPDRRSGPRELRAQQLDVNVRPDHSLEEAVASEDAVLVVLPGPGQAKERRTLKGAVLTFRWDEQGRLVEVLGQKDAEFLGEPLPPDARPARRLRSRNFTAHLDPVSGAIRDAEFNKDVEFERGTQKAKADRADLSGEEGRLTLNEEPSLIDEEQGSRLEANTIDLFTQTGDVRARYAVRHTLSQRPGRRDAFPGSDADLAVVTSRFFEYESAAHLARYREGALLRSGRSELRATEIRRVDLGPGRRRLEASGDVVSLLASRAKPGVPAEPPLDGRAQEMSYDEATHLVAYSGDAVLVQGEVSTKSPRALLQLAADGSELVKLEAFDPVELRQGSRIANGERAVYTPADKTIVVTGRKVDLKDESQQVHGRTLTFYVGDDRILVDGREEARTETILRRKP